MTDSKTTPRPSFRPAFPGDGPKHVPAATVNKVFSPDAPEFVFQGPGIVSRENAQRAALDRRTGFPSYLTNKKPDKPDPTP